MRRQRRPAIERSWKARTTVRMTVPVIRRPWKQRIADDLDGGFAMEMHAYLCDRPEQRDDIGRTTYARSDAYNEADRKKGIVIEAR